MTGKHLVILAAATAALAGAAYFIATSRTPTSTVEAAAQTPLFAGLDAKAGDIARIVLQKGKQQAVFVRDASGKNWVVENKGNFPAKFDQLRPIVSGMVEARIIEPKTAKPDLYDKLEIGDPAKDDAKSTLVTLKTADGKDLASLIIGKRDTGGVTDPFSPPPEGKAKRYVRRNGEAQSYLAEAELELQADPMAFVDKSVLELPNDKVKNATIKRPGGEVIHVYREKPTDGEYLIKDIPAGRTPKDKYAATRTAQQLAFVALDDVRPASEIDFNSPDATVYEVRCFDGTVITTRLVKKDDKTWASLSARYEDDAPAPAATTPSAAPPAANATADVTKPKGDGDEGDASKKGPQPEAKPESGPDAAKTDPAADAAAKAAAAKADEDARKATAATVKKQAEEWNAKWSPWAYALPSYKVDVLTGDMEYLLAPKTGEQNPQSNPVPPKNPTMTPVLPSGGSSLTGPG